MKRLQSDGVGSKKRQAEPTVGVKIKFPFSFRSTELNRYTVLTKNSYKTNKHL